MKIKKWMLLIALPILLLLLFAGYSTIKNSAKDNVIPHKKISWADFKGNVDTRLDYYAFALWGVSYTYDEPVFEGNTAKLKIKVTYKLKEESWHKPDKASDELLNHEQGHLNIAYLFALELQRTYDTSIYSRENYKNEIDLIYSEMEKKYLAMELLYDKETNHMYNHSEQKKWDEFFAKQISQHAK